MQPPCESMPPLFFPPRIHDPDLSDESRICERETLGYRKFSIIISSLTIWST
jgi:hypothetical protein